MSTDVSADISTDRLPICRSICRPTYRGRHIGRLSVDISTDMSTDMSVEYRSICRPISEMPTYGDLKFGDFFHPVSPPLPPRSTYPLHLPSSSPPPKKKNAPTHPPAAPSEYKNILPPLWICGKTGYLCQESLLVNRRSNQTIGYMAMIAKGIHFV